jgi:hypothetical protein
MGSKAAIGQNDGLGSPPDAWQPGDLLIRRHPFTTPPPGLYQPHIGWYNPQTGARLPLLSDGDLLGDRLLLEPIEISAP